MSSRLRCVLRHLLPPPPPLPATALDGGSGGSAKYCNVAPAGAGGAGFFPSGFSSHGPEADPDPEAAGRIGLSDREVAFFKRFGFIVKRGLIPKKELAPWVDHMWADAIPSCVVRSDPSTWANPERRPGWGPSPAFAAAEMRVGRVNRGWPAAYGQASIRWSDIGWQPGYVAATCAHPNVLRMVQALLGGAIKRPHRNRGMYIHFPRDEASLDQRAPLHGLGPHHDTQPSELFGFVYLDDVSPRSGGTCIWPTSPQRLYETLDYEQSYGFHPNDRYSQKMRETIAEIPPVEFVGRAGDVIFLHPLMLHSAGINSLAHGSGKLRVATVMEWQRARPTKERTLWWTLNDGSRAVRPEMVHQEQLYSCMVRADGSFMPAEDGRDPADEADDEVQLIHHHDAAEYLGPVPLPRPDDMWQNWRFNRQANETSAIVWEEPWWDRHGLAPPQTILRLKDVATLGQDGIWRLDAKSKLPMPKRLE